MNDGHSELNSEMSRSNINFKENGSGIEMWPGNEIFSFVPSINNKGAKQYKEHCKFTSDKSEELPNYGLLLVKLDGVDNRPSTN